MLEVLVLALLGAWAVFALRSMKKRRKSGCCSQFTIPYEIIEIITAQESFFVQFVVLLLSF